MAYLVESVTGDKRIQLGCEEFGRTLLMGTNWRKIRIGFRMWANPGVINFSTSGLVVGVCQGTANMVQSANCTDFVGIARAQAFPSAERWDWTNCTHYLRNGGTIGIREFYKIGAEIKANILCGSDQCSMVCSPALTHQSYFVDLQKVPEVGATTSVRATCYATTTATITTDYTLGALATSMTNGGATPTGGTFQSTIGPSAMAYTGNALWDTVCIAWDCSVPVIEISDVMVVRILV